MVKSQKARLVRYFLLSDIIAIFVSYFYSYGFRFYGYIIPVSPEKGIPPLKSYVAVFPLFLAIHLLIFFLQGFYKSRLKRTAIDDFFLITMNAVLTVIIIQGILNYFYSYSQGAAPLFHMEFKLSHLFLAVYFIVVIILISVLRTQVYFIQKKRYAKGLDLRNILIIGAGKMGIEVAQKLSKYRDLGFVVKGFLDDKKKPGEIMKTDGGIKVLGRIDELGSILENEVISDIYVALDLNNYPQIMDTFKIVNKYVVNVKLIPDLFQLLTLKARVEDLEGFPVISVDEPPMRGVMLILKRMSDILASYILLIILSPFLLFVSLFIKLTSKGPVLFHQVRVGLDGKKFIMHKFRTMVCDAEADTGPVMCKPGDARITKLGRILRKFSIDEIPQIANVLLGEMSLIGPRPERPVFVKTFREKIPKYMLRHKVKSGITGWAQVHGLRQDSPIDKRLKYDFYYIQNCSISLDLKIIWKTLKKGFIDKNL